jgi:hypothetical protein
VTILCEVSDLRICRPRKAYSQITAQDAMREVKKILWNRSARAGEAIVTDFWDGSQLESLPGCA